MLFCCTKKVHNSSLYADDGNFKTKLDLLNKMDEKSENMGVSSKFHRPTFTIEHGAYFHVPECLFKKPILMIHDAC